MEGKKEETENKEPIINFNKNELVDIVDEKEKEAYEGKIIEIEDDTILVHNINKKKDEKYKLDEKKVLKQWKPTRSLQKYNRIDIELGSTDYWVEGIVLEIDESNKKILVKYKNANKYKKSCEEWISSDSDRISPIGFYTKYNSFSISNKTSSTNASFNLPSSKTDSFPFLGKKSFHDKIFNVSKSSSDNNISLSQKQEIKFKEEMKQNNFEIKEVRGDGNCLFRAISDQIYGTDSHYEIIRKKCMDYLMAQKRYFELFIDEDFSEYIQKKSKNGVWGDDIEIEALSEIYNRPIEIYCGSAIPSKCFHEEKQKDICDEGIVTSPIRLSYHGGNHYNSVIPLENDIYKYKLYKNSLFNNKPGVFESKIIALAKDNEERLNKGLKISENEFIENYIKDLSSENKHKFFDTLILSLNKTDNNCDCDESEKNNKKVKTDNDINDEKNNTQENKSEKTLEKKSEKENKTFDLSAEELLFTNPSVQYALDLGFNMDEIEKAIDLCGDEDKNSLINYLFKKNEE